MRLTKNLKEETRASSFMGFEQHMSRAVHVPEAMISCKSDPRRLPVLSLTHLEALYVKGVKARAE